MGIRMDEDMKQAVRQGDTHAVKLLFDSKKLAVDARDPDEKTALHWAVIRNHPDLVELLLERRAQIDLGSETGDSAMHYAAREGHAEITALLLKHGANVNITNANGWTPLHWTAIYGHEAVANKLIEADANVFAEAPDTHHKTALSLAQSNHNKVLIKILERAMEAAENAGKIKKRERYP